jgi:hypothetical protein
MVGVFVTFDYDGHVDRDRIVKIADEARELFDGMPGLRYKFFTLDEQRGRATNFYVWDSEEAARGFFTQELEGRVTALYGMRPTIDYADIAGIVDNTSIKA